MRGRARRAGPQRPHTHDNRHKAVSVKAKAVHDRMCRMSGGSDDSCATLTCAVSRCKAYDGRRVRDTTGDPGTAERHVIEEFTVRYRSYTAKAKAIGYLRHRVSCSRETTSEYRDDAESFNRTTRLQKGYFAIAPAVAPDITPSTSGQAVCGCAQRRYSWLHDRCAPLCIC